ncbi:60s Acidic ribosomal protein [Ostertagia ostertagi]
MCSASCSLARKSVEVRLDLSGAGGLDCDMEDATKVVEALAGKSLPEVMEEGKKKLSSVPSGGGAEAKKEEPKEESDEDMGFGLFD